MPTDPQTHIHTDSLVIGSGIAGLSFAIKLAINSPEKEVLLLTKRALIETNTKYAQVGLLWFKILIWILLKSTFQIP